MNNFIQSDIENAIIHYRAAIMNVLHAFENGEIDYFNFDKHCPISLLFECLQKRGYTSMYDCPDSSCWYAGDIILYVTMGSEIGRNSVNSVVVLSRKKI